MAQRQCEKCGELVDEAKAFCPSCGSSFVEEEKRKTQSNFERLDSTVQMGDTMYNQMLSDMGLNIKKGAPPEKRVEMVSPVAPAAPRSETIKPQPVQSPEKAAAPAPVSGPTTDKGEKKKTYLLWIVAAAGLLVVVFIIAAAIAAFFFWYRTQRG